ncbi:MAG: preprotein translocase subunit SecG [Oscillospiraceae bacterium]|nr:preprotein translocase subunit SecG [Oscillospiraceae bacterium]
MNTLEIILGTVILIFAVFLTVAVLLQHGKSHNLSGTIAGGAETFFGKEKGRTLDKILSTVTSVVSVVFVIAVVVLYLLQT